MHQSCIDSPFLPARVTVLLTTMAKIGIRLGNMTRLTRVIRIKDKRSSVGSNDSYERSLHLSRTVEATTTSSLVVVVSSSSIVSFHSTPTATMLSFLLLITLVCVATAAPKKSGGIRNKSFLAAQIHASLLGSFPTEFGEDDTNSNNDDTRDTHRKRKRREVDSIFEELGPNYTRRAYRMEEESFWKLHLLLEPFLLPKKAATNRASNGARNGVISSSARLSVALRYFAGGSAYDIALVHGISHTEVFNSVWKVVDAVNACRELAIEFPSDHNKQRQLAAEFQAKSEADFAGCVGAIDGLLIWIEKPSEKNCELAECGPKKFFCGRKGKSGLSLQGTCDANRKFLDVSIRHPASTSDWLAFTSSALYELLESDENFLAPGLHLFGDNAYVNSRFMATPFKNVGQGSKDSYNFFHSQVC